MPAIDPNRNITRAAQAATDERSAYGGYMVRFMRNGIPHQTFFGDAKYGSKRRALKAARIARDEQEQRLGPTAPIDYLKLATRRSVRNTSKIVGVRWSEKTIEKNGNEYHYTFATAAWTVDPRTGKRGTKAFSVDKYGKRTAWDLAIAARAKGLRAYKKAVKAVTTMEA